MDFLPSLLFSALFLCLIKDIRGYFVNIDAHAEECFFDKVTSGTKMSLMFEVAEGGFLDIDVQVGVASNQLALSFDRHCLHYITTAEVALNIIFH